MKKKKTMIRSKYNPPVDKGEVNEEKAITMPGFDRDWETLFHC